MTIRHRSGLRPVCMLTHSYYEEDPRVRREAEALVERGRPVDVVALRRPEDEPAGDVDGVHVTRLNVQRHQGAGIRTYLAEYLDFFGRATLAATRAHRTRHYALLQIHTLPDFLVLAGLPLRLAGVPILLDLHEAMPEFFRARFPARASHIAHRALLAQERLAIRLADAVLTVNDALAARLVELGVPPSKVTVVLNSPNLARFDPSSHPSRTFMSDGVLRLVYGGAITPTYELDVALEALAEIDRVRPELPVVLDLYGRGDTEEPLRRQAALLGLGERVRFHGRIPIESMAAAIAQADIGLAPTRRTDFTDFSLSTKIFEYAAMGKVVVASRLPTVERYFGRDTIATYTPGDGEDLATTLLRLVDDPLEREARLVRTAQCVRDLSWDREEERYVALVDRLARDNSGVPAATAAASPALAPTAPTVPTREEP